MNKVQKIAAGLCLAALLAGGALTVRLYSERKATEAADAAQRARWENAEQAAAEQAAGAADGAAGGQAAGSKGKKEIDYAAFSDNVFDYAHALNRPQLFREKRILYDGKHYVRHTGTEAILLFGVDRKGEGFLEERLPIDQGQADAIYLIAHNTSRNTVKILQIPRDTMAVMYATDVTGKDVGEGVTNLLMAFNSGDGLEKSCERTREAVSRVLGGLEIKHYLAGDVNVITDLNDLLGGVTVIVPGDGLEWIDPAFKKGAAVTLHGQQAERFVRARDIKEDNTAIYRMERHKAYIIGFQKKLKQDLRSDSRIVDRMFDTIEGDMQTDMKRSEYVDLTVSMLSGGSDLTDGDFLMLPGEPFVGNEYDEYHPHYADINRMVLDLFYYAAD